jgi:hypothetical protein
MQRLATAQLQGGGSPPLAQGQRAQQAALGHQRGPGRPSVTHAKALLRQAGGAPGAAGAVGAVPADGERRRGHGGPAADAVRRFYLQGRAQHLAAWAEERRAQRGLAAK